MNWRVLGLQRIIIFKKKISPQSFFITKRANFRSQRFFSLCGSFSWRFNYFLIFQKNFFDKCFSTSNELFYREVLEKKKLAIFRLLKLWIFFEALERKKKNQAVVLFSKFQKVSFQKKGIEIWNWEGKQPLSK